MSNDTKNVTVNFPLAGILGLIFITLKLTNYITWSWWWVLAPFWAPLAFIIVFGLLAIAGAVVWALVSTFFRKK